MAYVYRHIRKDTNQPFYIGIGSDKYFSRAKELTRRNDYWNNITNKTEWYWQILCDYISYEEAKIKEIEFINLYKRKDDGGILSNQTKGGEGTLGFTPSNSKAIFAKFISNENNEILSFNTINDFLIFSKAKCISKRKSGQMFAKGYLLSFVKNDLIGYTKNILMTGKHKNHNPSKKSFYGLSPDKIEYKFTDLYSASKITGAMPQNISHALIGKYKHANKWIFYYETNEETINKNKNLDLSKKGKNNPSYGTCWIKNSLSNERKRIKKEELENWINNGWTTNTK